MARLDDGRVCFVLGALENEVVEAVITKKKRSYIEAIAANVLEPSMHRVSPKDDAYLSTSPWQVVAFKRENELKTQMIRDVFDQQGIKLPDFDVKSDGEEWAYRNKMEFSFWWSPETDKVDLAFYKRGSNSKIVVDGSSLAPECINEAAREFIAQVNELGIRAGDMKSIVFRSSAQGQVVASLFVKTELDSLTKIDLSIQGFEIWLSDKRSPASVRTKLLKMQGDTTLTDDIFGKTFAYGVNSFFQINVPMYELALKDIRASLLVNQPAIDMFSGVGSIGLSVSKSPVLIELDNDSVSYARQNADASAEVLHMPSEKALDVVVEEINLIVDPPRAGLNKKLLTKICEVRPRRLIYMSCDAATHARDVSALIEAGYSLDSFNAYNFFPKTPHTETLAVLTRSDRMNSHGNKEQDS